MFTIFADLMRLARAGWVLSRHDALLPAEYADYYPIPLRFIGQLSRIGARTRRDGRRLRPGERMAAAFERLGPFYVKTGQFMATRPDIIGFEMASDLGRLQDRMPPFDRASAVSEIERTFGKPLGEIFSEFSEPIAAASIAQVHKARLLNGETVAVKVLRPRIEQRAQRDFRAFGRAAAVIETVSRSVRRLEPRKFIETLRQAAILEFDLRLEAGAASEMADNFSDDKRLRIPDIIWAYSSRRILTIEWIDGTPLGDLESLDQNNIDRKALAVYVLRSFLTQALRRGFFHADMHQGNMMIDAAGRLVLIDFGIMGRLDEKTRRTFAEILYGFISRNYPQTAKAHFDAGYVPEHHNREAFAQALRSVGEPLYGKNADVVDMSRVLQQLFDVTELFDMHLRPELVMLQRTMVTVEGVARMLDPGINMWEAARPVVQDYLKESLGAKRQVENIREAARKTAEIAPHLPAYIEAIGKSAQALNSGHLTLTDQSTIEMMETLARERRLTRGALLFAGFAILCLAAAVMLQG